MSITPKPPVVNIGGEKPPVPPTPCPTCTEPRIWWANPDGDGFVPACPWCDDGLFTSDHDDDSDLDTLPEPTPTAPADREQV